MKPSRWIKAVIFLALPLALFFVLRERRSWSPVILQEQEESEYLLAALAFSPDGKLLAEAILNSNDPGPTPGVIRLWDVANHKVRRTLSLPRCQFTKVAFSPDGKTLVALQDQLAAEAYWQSRVVSWEVASGKLSHTTPTNTRKMVRDLIPVFLLNSPVGNPEAAFLWWEERKVSGRASRDQWLHVDILNCVKDGPPHKFSLNESTWKRVVGVAPDGRTAILCPPPTRMAAVRMVDVTTGKTRGRLPYHLGEAFSLAAYSDDGRLVACVYTSPRHGAQIWNMHTGQRLLTLNFSDLPRSGSAFSPDGNTFALSGQGRVILWNVKTGRRERELPASETGVSAIAFSKDGSTVAVGGIEGAIRLWRVR